MSAAAAPAADAAPAKGGGKKKLIIIIAAAVVLLAVIGGVAMVLLKKKHAEGEEDGAEADPHAKKPKAEEHAAAPPRVARDPKHPPTFMPLEPFTVNLADRDAERYAQLSVTLEISDAKVAEELKTYMPAIRNNILLLLSSKRAEQLLSREGKEKLAQSILYAAVRPLGYQIEEEDDEEPPADEAPTKKKKKKKKAPVPNNLPVDAVHFSNIIVQ